MDRAKRPPLVASGRFNQASLARRSVERHAQQRLDVPLAPAVSPARRNATKMTGTSSRIATDGDLRPSLAWSDWTASRPRPIARSSPSRDAVPGQVDRRFDDLRELPADVMQVRGIQPNLAPRLVELGPDASYLSSTQTGAPSWR